MPTSVTSIERLTKKQSLSLRLGQTVGLHTFRESASFLKTVGYALRHDATEGLPLAAMYRAVWCRKGRRVEERREAQRRAIELTTALLKKRKAVEVNIIADRLVLVHESLVAPIYALRRRGRSVGNLEGLSPDAVGAFNFIRRKKAATADEVRGHLEPPPGELPDRATIALGDLQRQLLIDRGVSNAPKRGIPSSSKEEYPCRIFHIAHKDLVARATRLRLEAAAATILMAYLKGAVFVPVRKLAAIFKLCLTENEVRMALAVLHAKKKVRIERTGETDIAILR